MNLVVYKIVIPQTLAEKEINMLKVCQSYLCFPRWIQKLCAMQNFVQYKY